ncbi:unnamed protein product [Cochlearia groenlandica]
MDEVMTVADAASSSGGSSPSPSHNLPIFSAFLALAIAQILKIFTHWYKEKRWDSKKVFSSGGMPSSHSSLVTALAVSIGILQGAGSSDFAIAVILSCIVMYDASGIRLHAGRQAELLNQIVCEFPLEHPLSTVRPLRELLGHTPIQVAAGGVLGCVVAYLMRSTS